MPKQHKLYIDGQWIAGDAYVDNVSPSDSSDVIGEYAQANPSQVEAALQAANRAVLDWGDSPLESRYQTLMAIGNELIDRSAELGELLAREEGKTRAEGIGEVYRSGQFFHYFAGEVHRQIDDRAESVRPGIEIDTRREPVGVVAIISPWNFPMATAVWKIAPALAFGNSVIFKPANLVPASAWALTEIISRQDALPPGTFNLVMGSGGSVGNTIIHSDKIHAVS
ncbi:aldehyde dehydrogenase family protein, partial [Luminiphilus sp.]|nr:aldehyde dehydrogenase family protein [Luminiphilus sp.]